MMQARTVFWIGYVAIGVGLALTIFGHYSNRIMFMRIGMALLLAGGVWILRRGLKK